MERFGIRRSNPMNQIDQADRFRPLRLTLTLVLALAALAYEAKGFATIIGTDLQDLRAQWILEKYIFNRQYPPDVVCGHGEAYGATPIHTGRNDAIDPALGKPPACAYPSWTFFTELLWMQPNWRATCLLFGAWNLGGLALVLTWSYRMGVRWGREQGWLLAMSAAAVSSICTTLRNGQFGLLIVAFLLAAMLCDQRNREIFAGILLGIAALKPTIAAPFFIIFLVRRRISVLASSAAYLAAAVAVIWAVSGAPPLDMFREMAYGEKIAGMDGYGPVDWLKGMGLGHSLSNGIPAVVGIITGLAITIAFRRIPLLPLMGMMSVISRLWAYHRHYDNVVLIFLLVALGEQMLRRQDRFSKAVFWMVGLSLWLPAKATEFEIFRVYQMIAWAGGLAALCVLWWREAAAPIDPTAAPIPISG